MKKQNNGIIEFAEKFAYGYDPKKGECRLLKLYEYQKQMLLDIEKNKFTIIKQSREMGISTVMAIYISNLVLNNSNKTVLAILNSCNCAEMFLDKIKMILTNTNAKFSKSNKREIVLKNGSKIISKQSQIDAGKGYAADLIFMEHFEYIKDSKYIFPSIYPTIYARDNAKFIINSTPLYKDDLYYQLWTKALNKENEFKPINIHWSQNPALDNKWYKKRCEILNDDSIKTELDGEFIEKPSKKESMINIRLKSAYKQEILNKMKKKNIKSITEYIMMLVEKDLKE